MTVNVLVDQQHSLVSLGTLPSDTPGKLDILGHDGHTLGMDSTQVSVLKKSNQVSL